MNPDLRRAVSLWAESSPNSSQGEHGMPAEHEIRADFDRDTIVVYQAYNPAIADAAVREQTFVAPFSFHRMTWVKPSFLWLMHRSNWGRKTGQQRTLAIRMTRSGWEQALALAVLTSPEPSAFRSPEEWSAQFARAKVHLQWDPERSLRGAALAHYSIQVGLSRHVIRTFVDEWVVGIEDVSSRVAKIYHLVQSGHADRAKRLLPPERVYPVNAAIGGRILIDD
jgi:hypothetical protein